MAQEIIRQWRNQDPPGRFLKFDEQSGFWQEVDDKRVCCSAVIIRYVLRLILTRFFCIAFYRHKTRRCRHCDKSLQIQASSKEMKRMAVEATRKQWQVPPRNNKSEHLPPANRPRETVLALVAVAYDTKSAALNPTRARNVLESGRPNMVHLLYPMTIVQ